VEHKPAIEVLKSLLEKHPLSPAEKEAVLTAIGVLSWSALARSRLKGLKERREKKAGL
jgi:hypothetical protein